MARQMTITEAFILDYESDTFSGKGIDQEIVVRMAVKLLTNLLNSVDGVMLSVIQEEIEESLKGGER